jgi:hypothetical protein
MFDAKFELDGCFGDAAPPLPKRKKERKKERTSWLCIDGLKLTPAEKACMTMPPPTDHDLYSLLFPHFLKLLCRPITLL